MSTCSKDLLTIKKVVAKVNTPKSYEELYLDQQAVLSEIDKAAVEMGQLMVEAGVSASEVAHVYDTYKKDPMKLGEELSKLLGPKDPFTEQVIKYLAGAKGLDKDKGLYLSATGDRDFQYWRITKVKPHSQKGKYIITGESSVIKGDGEAKVSKAEFVVDTNGNSNETTQVIRLGLNDRPFYVKAGSTANARLKDALQLKVEESKWDKDISKELDKIQKFYDRVEEVNNELVELGHFPSDEEVKKVAGFTKLDEFSTSTVHAMSNTLAMLHGMSKTKNSEETIQHYKKLLESMQPEFFRKVQVFLKEVTNDTKGWIDVSKGKIYIEAGKKIKGNYQTPAEVYMHELVHAMTYWGLRNGGNEAKKVKRQLMYVQKVALQNTKLEDLLLVPKEAASKEDWNRAKALHDYLFTGKANLDEFTAYALTNPAMMKHFSKIQVKEAGETTLLGKVRRLFEVLMDIVMGNYEFNKRDKNVAEQVAALALQLGKINSENYEKAQSMNPIAMISDMVQTGLDALDTKTAEAMHSMTKKLVTEGRIGQYPENGTVTQKLLWGSKFLVKGVTDPGYRDALGVWFSSIGGPFKAEGSIRQYLSDLFPEDEGKSAATWLTLRSGHIDQLRNSTAYQVANDVIESFKKPLTEEQEEAITAVLIDTNASHLVYTKEGRVGFDNAKMRALLSNKGTLDNAVKAAKTRIQELLVKDKARANVTSDLAVSLGIYMATGNANEATLFNAESIVKGVWSSKRFPLDVKLVAEVRELASLVALQNTDQKSKDIVAELLVNEREAMYKVMDTYEGFKYSSKKELFEEDALHFMDGYSKELFEPSITTRVAKVSEEEEMKKQGFTKVGPVKVNASINKETMALYVSEDFARSERQKGAINLGQLSAKGTSITDISYRASATLGKSFAERDIALANQRASEIYLKMAKGEYDFKKVNYGLSRVTDKYGKVVDYRVMMDKHTKKTVLKQDTKISQVLGWSVASIQNKVLKEIHDRETLNALQEGMKEWEGGEIGGSTGFVEYDLIGPNSTDPELKELYYMLPRTIKEFIDKRADKTLAVRRNLRPIYFGYAHAKTSEFALINKLSPQIKAMVDRFEALWFDIVSLVKETILIKMPWVISTNILSNYLQLVASGIGPIEAIKMQLDSLRDVRQYIADSREKLKLEQEVIADKNKLYRIRNSGTVAAEIAELKNKVKTRQQQISLMTTGNPLIAEYSDEVKTMLEEIKELGSITSTNGDKLLREIAWKEAKIKSLTAGLEASPIKELVDEGLMQALVEDVNTAQMNDNNMVSRRIDDIMQNMPAAVQTGASWVFLTNKTPYYKAMQETLQLSDLVARAVLNERMKQKEKERLSGDRNYDPVVIDEMKKLGVELVNGVPVTGQDLVKYNAYTRAVRLNTLKNMFINYSQPNGKMEEWANRAGIFMFTKYFKRIQRVVFSMGSEKPVTAALMVMLAAAGVDTIQGQSFLLKGEGLDGSFGLTNMVPVYSPVDVATTLVVPPLVRLGTSVVN